MGITISFDCTTLQTINWTFNLNTASGGSLAIFNQTTSQSKVNTSSGGSGSFTADIGNVLAITITANTLSGITAYADIVINDILVSSTSGSPSATVTYNTTVTGSSSIICDAYDSV